MKKITIAILSSLVGAVIGVSGIGYLLNKENNLQKEKVYKFKGYYNMLNQWLILKNENKSIIEYFKKNSYNTIAVYGIGEMGNRLIEELENSDIVIKYAIDKNSGGLYANIPVLDMDDHLDEVDVIVVTATFAFNEIAEELRKKTSANIISLEDLIYEL